MLRSSLSVSRASSTYSAARLSTVADTDVVIASVARTPIASFTGSLASFTAPQLGSHAIKHAVERAGIGAEDVDECYFGNVLSANIGQAPAKQAVLGAGLSNAVPCTTVHKVCASGLKATMLGAMAIQLGHADVIVSGGMESMSNTPYYVPKGRTGYRYGHGQFLDGVLRDGLTDAYDGSHMGNAAEVCAKTYNISREAQDEYAVASYARAAAASQAGKFEAEIAPITVVDKRKGDTVVAVDEEFSNIKHDKIPTLRPAFDKNGTVTAANASSLNDGACALVLMSGKEAMARGVTPIARIIGMADAAKAPVEFTTAPAKALPIAYARAGVTGDDIDFFEINEAFSVVALANMELLNISHDKINVNGGAVALGHPIGASGARILITLASVLQQNDATLGATAICNGGGGASAVVIERLS